MKERIQNLASGYLDIQMAELLTQTSAVLRTISLSSHHKEMILEAYYKDNTADTTACVKHILADLRTSFYEKASKKIYEKQLSRKVAMFLVDKEAFEKHMLKFSSIWNAMNDCSADTFEKLIQEQVDFLRSSEEELKQYKLGPAIEV